MIYFDNASTTFFKPKSVKKAVNVALKRFTANASRSAHNCAIKTAEQVLKVREKFAQQFNCDVSRVIFTSGCTESLNLAICGSVKNGGHIILTCFEHNSVLRTVEHLKQTCGINFTVLYPENSSRKISIQQFEKAIQVNTYLIIANHISNITGDEQNIYEIGKFCKKHNFLFLVDGAQSGGHKIINMKESNISFLALAGHKGLLGLQGVGALCVAENVKLKPIKFGGTGTFSENIEQPKDFPEGFESGTFSALNIISMGVGLQYAYHNLIAINNKILKLNKHLYASFANNDKIVLYSKNIESGIFSFNIKNKSPQEVASILNNKYNIAVRAGFACAPLAHIYLGTNKIGGVVRVSIGNNNSMRDVKKLIKALREIIKN